MAVVASILPNEYTSEQKLKFQAQSHHFHNNNGCEDDDDEYDDIILLSPANSSSSSSSDDATLAYPETPIATEDDNRKTGVFAYGTMDDEAIMKSYLDPAPTPAVDDKNKRKPPVLSRLKNILKKDDDVEDIDAMVSSPPPRSPCRSNTALTYTPQLDTSKIIDWSSPQNNNNRSMSSSSTSTCSSTASSHSTVATSAASCTKRNESPFQPVTRLSAMATNTNYSPRQPDNANIRPTHSTSSSRFKSALLMFRSAGPGAQHGNCSRNSVAPSSGKLQEGDDAAILLTPSKSMSLAGKIKSKFQKKPAAKEPSGSSMPRSTSLSSITSSWSKLTNSREHVKGKKQRPTTAPSGIPVQHRQSTAGSPQYLNILNGNNDSGSMYYPATRHSMYCTTNTSDDHRPLYHLQQEQKRRQHQQYHHYQQPQGGDYHRQSHGHHHRPQHYHQFQRDYCRQPQPVIAPGSPLMTSEGSTVRFAKVVSVRETYSRQEYDRGSDPDAVCARLTPAMAYFIKEELNTYKLHEMQVHESSRGNTHFFF
ncbi:hypothetical protein BJV82DRAFT_146122 [Fennellomyces sp. T-0311]|nr:hypothetical protein BJV82DRAFT_146122 [Fennellomyces sp. T-0311]